MIKLKKDILESVAPSIDHDAQLEIESISAVLKEYNFSFADILSSSKISNKTKRICAKIIVFICGNKQYIDEMRKHKILPTKEIRSSLHMSQKIIEKHQRYIITVTEIICGNYPILSDYFKYIRDKSKQIDFLLK